MPLSAATSSKKRPQRQAAMPSKQNQRAPWGRAGKGAGQCVQACGRRCWWWWWWHAKAVCSISHWVRLILPETRLSCPDIMVAFIFSFPSFLHCHFSFFIGPVPKSSEGGGRDKARQAKGLWNRKGRCKRRRRSRHSQRALQQPPSHAAMLLLLLATHQHATCHIHMPCHKQRRGGGSGRGMGESKEGEEREAGACLSCVCSGAGRQSPPRGTSPSLLPDPPTQI